MESSYVPVESLIFGRLAYKGMNAEIENLMLEVGLRKNRTPVSVWDR